jgi:hypothetical protein
MAALVFQCFEGIELSHVQTAATSLVLVLRLQPVHRLIVTLLGRSTRQSIISPAETAECGYNHLLSDLLKPLERMGRMPKASRRS